MSELALRGVSAVGFVTLLGIAWLCAEERRRPSWRLLGWGVGAQLLLGVLLLESAERNMSNSKRKRKKLF